MSKMSNRVVIKIVQGSSSESEKRGRIHSVWMRDRHERVISDDFFHYTVMKGTKNCHNILFVHQLGVYFM